MTMTHFLKVKYLNRAHFGRINVSISQTITDPAIQKLRPDLEGGGGRGVSKVCCSVRQVPLTIFCILGLTMWESVYFVKINVKLKKAEIQEISKMY